MDFGYTLRTMRKAAGISLRRLAQQVGVSAAYLSQVERGTLAPPTNARLKDIADALGVPPPCLLVLTDRLSAEIVDFVHRVPEVAGFLRIAREKSLGPAEFQLLAEAVDVLEVNPFVGAIRKLIKSRPTGPGLARPFVQLLRHVDENLVWHDLAARDKKELLRVLSEGVARVYPEVDSNIALNRLLRREKEASTGIGNGVAVPHATLQGLSREVVSVATLADPIPYDAVDGEKVSVVFLLVGREGSRAERLKLLAHVAQMAAAPTFTKELRQAHSRGELIEILTRADGRVR
jgi:nitrogen PTS system EIIA component